MGREMLTVPQSWVFRPVCIADLKGLKQVARDRWILSTLNAFKNRGEKVENIYKEIGYSWDNNITFNCFWICSIVRNKAAEKAKHVHQHHHQIPQGHNTSESLDSSTGASSEHQGPTAVTAGGIKSNVNLAAAVIAHTPTGGSSSNLQEIGPSTDNTAGNNEGNGNSLSSAMQQAAEQRSPVLVPGPGPGPGPGPRTGPGPGSGSGSGHSASGGSGSGYSINGILGLQQQHSHHLQSSSNNNNSISTNNNSSSETSKRKRIEIHGKHYLRTDRRHSCISAYTYM